MYVVELQRGCWLAPWDGDPGRTLVLANAQQWKRKGNATRAMQAVLDYRAFRNARVLPWADAVQPEEVSE